MSMTFWFVILHKFYSSVWCCGIVNKNFDEKHGISVLDAETADDIDYDDPVEVKMDEVDEEVKDNSVQFSLQGMTVADVSISNNIIE